MSEDPSGPLCLPLAVPGDPVRYVVIDDEPRYRRDLGAPATCVARLRLEEVGTYADVETFLALHRDPCHVVVLDLCLNRRTTRDTLQGVRAVRHLAEVLGLRVLVHTSDERPEPVARCVAAGAVGYVSKYVEDLTTLPRAVTEAARTGTVHSPELVRAVQDLVRRCRDVRLPASLEATLVLLDRGLNDREVAERRGLSPATVKDHKRRILEVFGAEMDAAGQGYAGLVRELGVGPGDLVNDAPVSRTARGLIRRATARLRRPHP